VRVRGTRRRVILLFGRDTKHLHARLYPYPLAVEDARKILRLTVKRRLAKDPEWKIARLFYGERRDLLFMNLPEKAEDETENRRRERGETVGR